MRGGFFFTNGMAALIMRGAERRVRCDLLHGKSDHHQRQNGMGHPTAYDHRWTGWPPVLRAAVIRCAGASRRISLSCGRARNERGAPNSISLTSRQSVPRWRKTKGQHFRVLALSFFSIRTAEIKIRMRFLP